MTKQEKVLYAFKSDFYAVKRNGNLELTTKSKNNLHSFRYREKTVPGYVNHNSKLTIKNIIEIRKNFLKLGRNYFAKKFNVSHSTTCAVINNKTWNHV